MRTGGGPFTCADCGEKDKEERNCSNFKGLTEAARAVSSYSEPIKQELLARGCAKVISLGDIRLYECPLSYISEDTLDMMRTVFMMESSGARYFSGGLADQPCWAVEAFEIYQAERSRIAGEKNGTKGQ